MVMHGVVEKWAADVQPVTSAHHSAQILEYQVAAA
jgi:hypothetical protein